MKKKDPDVLLTPATLEGCLVKISDTVSYLGRDIEDAISLKILDRSSVPNTILGSTNREILRYVAQDIIRNSVGKEHIAISTEVFDALSELRAFNFKEIYSYPKLKVESSRIDRSYHILFDYLLEDLNQRGEESVISTEFASNKTDKYKTDSSPVQMVVDYLSGMTDHFFVRVMEKLALPRNISL